MTDSARITPSPEKEKVSIADNGIFVKGEQRGGKWVANITLDIRNSTCDDTSVVVLCRLTDKQTRQQAAEYKFHTFTYKTDIVTKTMLLYVPDPKLWDIGSPNLYTCDVWLYDGDRLLDSASVDFGFCTVGFDPDEEIPHDKE